MFAYILILFRLVRPEIFFRTAHVLALQVKRFGVFIRYEDFLLRVVEIVGGLSRSKLLTEMCKLCIPRLFL